MKAVFEVPAFPEMDAAIAWLQRAGIKFFKPSDRQLKIGSLSYYPRRGTMNYDNCESEDGRGLAALRELLAENLKRELPPVD